jgi:hypothetical protein
MVNLIFSIDKKYCDLRQNSFKMSAQPTVTLSVDEAIILRQLCAASQERGAIRMEESEYIVRVWKKLHTAIEELRRSSTPPTANPPVRAPVSSLRTPTQRLPVVEEITPQSE